MKKSLHIQLRTIPEKGWDFDLTHETQELNADLKDLIGDSDYSIQFHIKPTGEDTYKISGSINAKLNLLCCRCAYAFNHQINKKFSETIIVLEKQKRKDKETRINHYSEQSEQEDFTILNNYIFKVGEFMHELITVEEPIRPLPFPECDLNDLCENLQKVKKEKFFYKDTNLDWQKQLKPFLKNQSSDTDTDSD